MNNQNHLDIHSVQSTDIDSLVALYRACFAEPPWFEEYDATTLRDKFAAHAHSADSHFLAAHHNGVVVGGCLGYHVREQQDVYALINPAWLDAFYLSEVFVSRGARLSGIANQLMDAIFATALDHHFTTAVVRTSIDQPIIQHLCVDKRGMQIVAEQSGRRIIMAGKL